LDEICRGLPRDRRTLLETPTAAAFYEMDVGACLLGENLWYDELATFRDHLRRTGERPHLWEFEFGPSAAWDSQVWRGLSLAARVARARIGSLAHQREWMEAPASLGLRKRSLRSALYELQSKRLCVEVSSGVYTFAVIASPAELDLDLSLVRILAHWLHMLAHADRISLDERPSGYDVHGFAAACGMCRERWGVRERAPEWVPPFHPGCRCFAQPRYAA
jgi:hypothetical protein